MITPECERSLDEYEGFPHLYEKKSATVSLHDHGDVEAMFYVMAKPSSLEPPIKPYVNLIAKGYSDFGVLIYQLNTAIREAEQTYEKEI